MKRLFAFWEDYAERESQITDGLGRFVEACVEAIVPALVLLGLFVMVALHVPHPALPLGVIGLAGVAYGAWWFPYCRGKALDQLPKILGREPTKALGAAHLGTLDDMKAVKCIGGPEDSNIYLGRLVE